MPHSRQNLAISGIIAPHDLQRFESSRFGNITIVRLQISIPPAAIIKDANPRLARLSVVQPSLGIQAENS